MATRVALHNACALSRPSAPARIFPTAHRCRVALTSTRLDASYSAPPVGASRRAFSASSTAIKAQGNGARDKIMESLRKLAKTPWVNGGRVQLALRSLEVEDATVRVAVLGSGSGQLIAALLSEPSTREEEWLKQLRNLKEENERGVLIRYGPKAETIKQAGSPLKILEIPVEELKRSRIEILLAPLASGSKSLAVPVLRATNIPGARVMEYPVHKTLLWAGEGVDGLRTLISEGYGRSEKDIVIKAISLPKTLRETIAEGVMVVDLSCAEGLMKCIEEATGDTYIFERDLELYSGIPQLRQWVFSGAKMSDLKYIKPAVKNLVASILSETEALLAEERRLQAHTASPTLAQALPIVTDTMETLSSAVISWSERAHTEIRDTLDAAFTSKTWRKLAWWKLLWAIDDVSSNSQTIICEHFLPETQRDLLFLSGRLHGAGFRGDVTEPLPPAPPKPEVNALPLTEKPEEWFSSTYSSYPRNILHARDEILASVIPGLQSVANRLLAKTVSTSGLSFALSALLYASDVSMFSALSVAALGTVVSARRLQKQWEREEWRFKKEVREMGRKAIVGSERLLRDRLNCGVAMEEEHKESDKIKKGEKFVEEARNALREL